MSSTTVPNASEVPGPDVEITPLPGYPDPLVAIRLYGHPDRLANVSRTAFLAAVETECGVRIVPADTIVIERADVPKIEIRPGGPAAVSATGGIYLVDDWLEAGPTARALLAIAEYLAAHPPVPPASDEDVETLAEAIFTARWNNLPWEPRAEERKNDYRAQARRLLATGRVQVTR